MEVTEKEEMVLVSTKLLAFCETAIAEAYCIRHYRKRNNPFHADCLVNMCMEIEERDEALKLYGELLEKGEFPVGYYQLRDLSIKAGLLKS